ncbi:MAG: GNAT family N-acetyltransferase [Candidatus Eremiobacteraeota bacterium]|nr:GNAT family N-acetyltransferase [Candidatus Eremiobacteraeota bacterium]
MIDGFTIQPLTRRHERGRFSCGQVDLDRYLHELARKQDENDTTRVHVYASDTGEIAGYYTLSPLVFEVTGLPPALQRGRSHHVLVPATLLGRLAVDGRYRGRRLGSFLLSHAMRSAVQGSAIVASAVLVIDAKPEALDWYLRHGLEFERMPDMPLRLLLPMESIRAELNRSSAR